MKDLTYSFTLICSILLLAACFSFMSASDAVAGSLTPGGESYDFNHLTGSNIHPFTNLDGQDGWTSTGWIAGSDIPGWWNGVTQSLGFDGTQALRFQRVGPGYGASAFRVNNGSWSFPTFDGPQGFIQADFGIPYWGQHFGLAYDENGDNKPLWKSQYNELGVWILTAGINGVWVRSQGGTNVNVPLANIGGGGWVRLRLEIDLEANSGRGSGDLYYQNLSNGDTSLQPVSGMQGIDLGFDPGATNALNPAKWNAMFNHVEGAAGHLDNILIGAVPANTPPVALCKDLLLDLDDSGQATLDPSDVDNGSHDPDGDPITLSLDKTSFTCDDLGPQTVSLTVTDDQGASASCGATVTVRDVTPPEVAAALTPVQKPKSNKSNKSSKYYQVVAQATDICDESPVVASMINQPLTLSDIIDKTKYKKVKKENKIEIKIGKKIEVTLRGPDEGVLQGLLNDALVRGGFVVADGQVLKLMSKEPRKSSKSIKSGKSSKSNKSNKSDKSSKSNKGGNEKDPRKGKYTYEFDLGLTLEEVDGVAIRLMVSAEDASGNVSEPVEVAPPARGRAKPVLSKPALAADSDEDALTFGASNYPNPFNPETVIQYTLAEAGDVRLVIYNVLGQQVRELVNASQSPGQYHVRWNSRDAFGHPVSSGVYFYRLVAGSDVAIKKMLLMK